MPTKNDPVEYNDQMRRLTPRQKDCLRLVARGYQSKPIARELGISHLRVDKHIAEARRILGTASRSEAAKLLRAWELQQDASARNIPWGAPPLALPENLHLSSNENVDPIGAGMPVQKPKAIRPQQPAPDVRPGFWPFDLEGSANHHSRKPSAFALSIALVGALAALGAVATLLFALDWVGRS